MLLCLLPSFRLAGEPLLFCLRPGLRFPGEALLLCLLPGLRFAVEAPRFRLFQSLRFIPPKRIDQTPECLVECSVVEIERVPARQTSKGRRQLVRPWHLCASHQDGDYTNLSRQSCPDLEADKVFGVVDPTPPLCVGHSEPLLANHHQHRIASRNGLFDHFNEIRARIDAVDIHEHLALAKLQGQPIVQSSRVRDAVFTPVTDKYRGHVLLLCRSGPALAA